MTVKPPPPRPNKLPPPPPRSPRSTSQLAPQLQPPPPPPPPRSPQRVPSLTAPPPPPPPPPKVPTQLQVTPSHNGIISSKSNCTSGLLNNGSSVNSLNSTGNRYGHTQSHGNGSVVLPNPHNTQRCYPRHGDTFSSRSSLTNHGSLHHHVTGFCGNSGNRCCRAGDVCIHQTCACQVGQHSHINSSSLSDNGSFNQENGNMMHDCDCSASTVGCHHHIHAATPKCQAQTVVSQNLRMRINGIGDSCSSGTMNCNSGGTMTRVPFYSGDLDSDRMSSSCLSDSGGHSHCGGNLAHVSHHHHHHHAAPNADASLTSSLSSLQPVNQNINQYNRCASQSSANSTSGDIISRAMPNSHCIHPHRANIQHHQSSCCGHHVPLAAPHHTCGGSTCGHANYHGYHAHLGCGSTMIGNSNKIFTSSDSHDYSPALSASQASDLTHIDPLISTVHTHNLSNSSTTTHTSNVAVRHQSQYPRQTPFKNCGGRSNSSQQYEHYGLSSAASTSSANASLSSYQTNGGYEDITHLNPIATKMKQPLPPPPIPSSKSRPPSPSLISHRAGITSSSQGTSISTIHLKGPQNKTLPNPQNNSFENNSGQPNQRDYPHLRQQINGNGVSTVPTKLDPPNTTNGKHPTTLNYDNQASNHRSNQTSSMDHGSHVMSLTPQLPLPPPPPPPSSRPQISAIRDTGKTHSSIDSRGSNPLPDFINLNLGNRNGLTEAKSKLEELTRQVEHNLERQKQSGEPHGICPKCETKVMPTQEACKAMNQIYHAACFICCECNRTLSDKTFYPVGDKVYCEEDFKYTGHMQSLEKCAACSQPILDMILPAMGKSYHPGCFKCSVCGQCLDGIPFTIDRENKIYCVKDYHSIYSPKCDACGKTISPIDTTGETFRVVSMDKNYHIDCYCCEDCGLQLTDEEPRQSFPMDNHLLCQQCHIKRRNKMQV